MNSPLAPFPQHKNETIPALTEHNSKYVRVKRGHPFGKTEFTIDTAD